MVKNKDWLEEELNDHAVKAQDCIGHTIVIDYDFVIDLIRKFTAIPKEPIPSFVADWIEKQTKKQNYSNEEISAKMIHDYPRKNLRPEFSNWLGDKKNFLVFFRALENGYTIEEPTVTITTLLYNTYPTEFEIPKQEYDRLIEKYGKK